MNSWLNDSLCAWLNASLQVFVIEEIFIVNSPAPNFAFALTITRFKFITDDLSDNINENRKNCTTGEGKERI